MLFTLEKKQNTTVYFRVSDVFRDVKIVARVGDTVLLEKKKQKLAPAEMETVTLTAEMLEMAKGKNVSLSLE